MMHEVVTAFGSAGSTWHISAANGIALEPLLADLRGLERSGEPVLLAGTSFTFVHLFDALRERAETLRLPRGSRVMDTGGFKGRTREVARVELMRNFEAVLGLAPEWIVNEYGMTEMGSQFYDGIAGQSAGGSVATRARGGCVPSPWTRRRWDRWRRERPACCGTWTSPT